MVEGMRTDEPAYTDRLTQLSGARWKRLLDVQRPYRWNLRRYDLGRTLDLGCGIGRNLAALPLGSVGVDHNATSVEAARARGFEAYTPEEFASREWASFDGMLVAHVIEHLSPDEGLDLVRQYVPYLKPYAKVLFICPQERGYAYDPTHVRWTTQEDLISLASDAGLAPDRARSFPFPRWMGRRFTFNEFNVLATRGSTMIAPESRWGLAEPKRRQATQPHTLDK